MALNPVRPLYSGSATATNGSNIVTVTGNVNCSFLSSGSIVAIGNRQLVDAVSGTAPDGSGNSTITLRRNWIDPTTTAPLLAFMSYEGLADAVVRLRQIIEASEGSLAGSFNYMGNWDASLGSYPPPVGEGLGSQLYRVSVAGSMEGRNYRVGEMFYYDQFSNQWRSMVELITPFSTGLLINEDAPAWRVNLGLGNLATTNTNNSTANYLRGDGLWVTPPNTTYSEIPESEITTGTASTLRTITGRRMKFALDTKANLLHTHETATISEDGFMTSADKTKLDGIAAGAQVNVATNLATTTAATTLTVTSSTGTNATLPAATTTVAGVMTGADKTKLNGIATGATLNSTDAALRDRSSHTGTQSVSTITGLGTAATAIVTTTSTDTTEGRLLKVGDFGLGGSAINGAGAYLDSLIASGIYREEIPSNGINYSSTLNMNSSDGRQQLIISRVGDRIAFRGSQFGSGTNNWSPWREIYHSVNILGTVSQSSGIPTGSIIQRGSNANGEFVRFADGTQICWQVLSSTGGIQSWSFPVSFIGGSIIVNGTSRSGAGNTHLVATAAPSTTAVSLSLIVANTASYAAAGFPIGLVVHGRWY